MDRTTQIPLSRTMATGRFSWDSKPIVVYAIIAGMLSILSFLLVQRSNGGKTQLPLPPQPPGSFATGNLSEVLAAVNKKQQHLLFGKWAREYGEIMRVRSGPFVQYFINSDKAVKEIFDRNSAFTSNRPRWIASSEQICGKLNVLLISADQPRWKHQRKVIHSHVSSPPRADATLPYLHYESAKFLNQVVQCPSEMSGWMLYRGILRYTYSTFASQMFGMDIPDDDNPVIHDIHETGLAQILGTLPGFSLVDFLPILDNLPLLLKPWEQRNRQRFQRDMRFVKEKLERIRKLKAQGSTRDAFLPSIEAGGKSEEFGAGVDEASYLSLMLVIGAADTSAVSTWTFMEAMMLYPDVQEKARDEICRVVGDRIPVWDDLERIPYVRCLMKETWRWRPPVALGHPHITTRELSYNGMRVPKGAQIHLNAWAIHHDPNRHYNPDQFIPERFEGDTSDSMQSLNSKDVTQRDHFAFGAGRRVCPGYHVAERSLAVAIMRLLWAFKIHPSANASLPLDPLDFEGEVMPAVADKRMPVRLSVISQERRRHVQEAFETASSTRIQLEPLADAKTGIGAFEKLPFSTIKVH